VYKCDESAPVTSLGVKFLGKDNRKERENSKGADSARQITYQSEVNISAKPECIFLKNGQSFLQLVTSSLTPNVFHDSTTDSNTICTYMI
jgi:hypothetical protein